MVYTCHTASDLCIVHTHVHTDTPGAGSKKRALKKLRAKVDLDQEKGEVANNTCMDLWEH